MGNSPIRVLAFVSEILSAKTLVPIINALRSDPEFCVRIINDGFCAEFVRSLALPVEYIVEDFESRIDVEVRSTSVVLMGKSYVQPSEYSILRRAAHWGVPVLLVVPDMGLDVVRAKLKGIGVSIPWPKLLLADHRTRESLGELRVPADRVVEFGNPYFDDLYAELRGDDPGCWDPVGIGYFSTPFELDFKRGILPADYRHRDFVDDIRRVCFKLGQPLQVKRHPQVDPDLFDGLTVFDGTPLQMIRKIRVAVGSYSTTLLEAYVAGIPTISYQPWEANIREDVFACRIPIVKTPADFEALLRVALLHTTSTEGPNLITYNPGRSLEAIQSLLKELALAKANAV